MALAVRGATATSASTTSSSPWLISRRKSSPSAASVPSLPSAVSATVPSETVASPGMSKLVLPSAASRVVTTSPSGLRICSTGAVQSSAPASMAAWASAKPVPGPGEVTARRGWLTTPICQPPTSTAARSAVACERTAWPSTAELSTRSMVALLLTTSSAPRPVSASNASFCDSASGSTSAPARSASASV
ncbi:MAG: hypothetical protein BRC31_03975 [Actinobacteria bacterium QS_5_72_10]|nr:MAG: hypothetical protein BRC31_03975 [Actinobacteria bacterium QS_5_72_10]